MIYTTDSTDNTESTEVIRMKITLKGKENVYEQIASEYKRYILLNVIRYDEKLPSCRALAIDLGINPNTVARAYNVLEKEGYIKVIPKKGVYVSYKIDSSEDWSNKKVEIMSFMQKMKEAGIKYETLTKILDEVYGGEEDD